MSAAMRTPALNLLRHVSVPYLHNCPIDFVRAYDCAVVGRRHGVNAYLHFESIMRITVGRRRSTTMRNLTLSSRMDFTVTLQYKGHSLRH